MRDMRDDQRRQRLTDANPWWRAIAGGQDPIARTGHHPVKWAGRAELPDRAHLAARARPTLTERRRPAGRATFLAVPDETAVDTD
jgi:hypothetical protein